MADSATTRVEVKYQMMRRRAGCLYFPNHHWIYIPIRKVATSTISEGLRTHLGIPRTEPSWQIPLPGVPWDELAQYVGKVPIFTVVRPPRDRLLSAYCQKILRNDTIFIEIHKLCRDMTFEQFAGWAMRDRPIEEIDYHVRPQWWFVCHGGDQPICDTIIHLEDLDAKLAEMFPDIDFKIRNVSPTRDYQHLWTDELKARHREFYKDDFEKLGFPD